jgi:hypothetical protein
LAETGKRYVFHLVGERFTLEEDERGVAGANRLVLIGQKLDLEDLRARLAQCLSTHSRHPERSEGSHRR